MGFITSPSEFSHSEPQAGTLVRPVNPGPLPLQKVLPDQKEADPDFQISNVIKHTSVEEASESYQASQNNACASLVAFKSFTKR